MSESSETDRLLLTQEKVKHVEDITRENIGKVLNRGDQLSDLQRRADDLKVSAGEFNITARRVKRKMCWKNAKLWVIMLFILIVILVVLIIALVATVNSHKKKN